MCSVLPRRGCVGFLLFGRLLFEKSEVGPRLPVMHSMVFWEVLSLGIFMPLFSGLAFWVSWAFARHIGGGVADIFSSSRG